ncbi:ribosomal protein L6, alpha-beta domain-containing protein [Infundibulicybe gibba]|nr:ribosomal protein L6, alpha-beta domain-containing protein [Infundibulicybe gibba]
MILRPQQLACRALRTFSTTARSQAHVSHIGREPIKYPTNVTLTPSPTSISITGPLGATSVPLKPYMRIEFPEEQTMSVIVEDAEVKEQRQMWGTTRTLIANAIMGMTTGFSVPLFLVGVGYRVALEEDPRGTADGGNGKRLNMKLGYSHSVFVPVPACINIEVPSPTKIVLGCTDKHLLGLFAAKVRSHRKPEPYKGKGIFIGNEQIRIKSVKKK